ncbi:hypothetical protein J132_01535 [Termitomyces sp. J132]|nr:hypothetical protein H2248_008024 [Termitomyces sp. 'cryptogamus']KNZ75789.1 hypothetical protein J132_01535 [Termitomyces sp. J132]
MMERTSRSPSRRVSFGLQALGAKLSRTLSRDRGNDDKDADSRSISTVESKDRSQSRGRDVFQSSGRGGAGNIRRASISREARPADGPDDFSITRGREPVPAIHAIFSTGRGGAGNIRSPSRDPAVDGDTGLSDAEVIRAHVAGSADIPHSSGRGGAGNIFTARSRSRSRGPPTASTFATPPRSAAATPAGTPHTHLSPLPRSTGRGGAGNFGVGALDAGHTHIPLGPARSTGRGGAGNIGGYAGTGAATAVGIGDGVPEGIEEGDEDATRNETIHPGHLSSSSSATASPAIERASSSPQSQKRESTGRGGAGNISIVRDY